MGLAFGLPSGQVPHHGMPGGAIVGWAGVQEQAIGEEEAAHSAPSKCGRNDQPCGANDQSKGAEGFVGLKHRGAGTLEPWATPPGAPNKHNGQLVAEPGGLAQGEGVKVLPRADRPRTSTPRHIWMQSPRGWVQVHSEDPRQLRFAIAGLWGCEEADFWMTCEERVLGVNMELPPDGGHVQVRMRGVGGMHPGFATPNEIEEAMREEEERKGTARETVRKVPPLSNKELSALMEMDHKPQWVCRLLVFFKAALDGKKVDPQLMECTLAWKSSDLQEELVMSPEKAKISDVWTSAAWLEAITAPMDGSDGGGGPPIPALIANYVESLWVLLVSAMGSYNESYRQHAGKGRGSEAPKEAGEPPENFGDTTVPVDEVRRRLASLRRRFSYENGRRIWISKNDNEQRTDMMDPPTTGCCTCKPWGDGQEALVFCLPLLRMTVSQRGGGRTGGGGGSRYGAVARSGGSGGRAGRLVIMVGGMVTTQSPGPRGMLRRPCRHVVERQDSHTDASFRFLCACAFACGRVWI